MSTRRYQTFLSHNSDDKEFVRQVAARLQAENISFFFDEAALIPGTVWQDALETAIADSDSCVVFLGPEGMGPWHKLEMRAALSEQIEKNRGFRVIPVLLPGTRKPSDDLIPSFLKQLTWVVFRGDPSHDQEALRRLKCGILGQEPGFTPPASATALTFPADLKIVPRGLRSYEPEDHPFFLKLVPGVRDESGLPRIIRDWKKLIERVDPRRTFNVAYWYGPSGCGKSSLFKAGLLPTLADYVVVALVSASPTSTESDVQRELRRVVPTIPNELSLSGAFGWLAEHPEALAGRTLLVVLDQFEQWLHGRRGQLEGELAAALRHCNGHHLQTLLLVRDDFTVAVHRFMTTLGCELREHFNCQLVDLFTPEFARQVLYEYGRAYERLPERATDLSDDQKSFLEQITQELTTNDGKVAPVHLALLAQMLANKPWTRANLRAIGGAAGVGHAFLEETFDSRASNAIGRIHREAAAKLLEVLLPEAGSLIKGHRRTRDELIEVTGYTSKPNDFVELINFLDRELRIITPVSTDDEPCYQLTHDFLVPSLRDWLTAKQCETWRGRAMLLLAERTAEWMAKPHARSLPGPLEYLRIMAAVVLPTWRLTRPCQPSSNAQFSVLWAATRWYAMSTTAMLAIVLGIVLGAWWEIRRGKDRDVIDSAVANLPVAKAADVPAYLNNLRRRPDYAAKQLRLAYDDEESTPYQRLHLAYGLIAVAAVQESTDDVAQFAVDNLDHVPPDENHLFVDALSKLINIDCLTESLHTRSDLKGVVDEEQIASRMRYALAAVSLGRIEAAERLRVVDGDPTSRTLFIRDFPRWPIRPSGWAASWRDVHDPQIRSGLCLALGAVDHSRWTEEEFGVVRDQLLRLYREDPDSGVHSAAGWALQEWKVALPDLPQLSAPPREPGEGGRSWFVNSLGMTMIRVPKEPKRRYRIGSGANEDGYPIREVSVASFWLSDREVTIAQIQSLHVKKKTSQAGADVTPASKLQEPAMEISWFDAVNYCNALSVREGLRPYYRLREVSQQLDGSIKGAQVETGVGDGYRLPTETEWEVACRAGTTTEFSCGNKESELRDYAWFGFDFMFRDARPVAKKRPNPWGLHDMHGNVAEWCENWAFEGSARWDFEGKARAARGGTWHSPARDCRSAYRYGESPDMDGSYLGFRPALTLSQ